MESHLAGEETGTWFRWTCAFLDLEEELVDQRCDEVLSTGLANLVFSAQKGLMKKLQLLQRRLPHASPRRHRKQLLVNI